MGCASQEAVSAEEQSAMQLVDAALREDPNARIEVEYGENRIVCRREVVVGSRVPQTVCRDLTWEERNAENTREVLRGAESQVAPPTRSSPMGGGPG